MRYAIVVLWILLGSVTSAFAQVSIGVRLPGVSIGINLPLYPELVEVPGYPVYYAPSVESNFFFYDGMYWVYQSDSWYASDWYNGPWGLVDAEYVPPFVLRIPVRYYRNPPPYFRGWQSDAAPRWGEHWGNDWERRHGGWDRWNRASAPALAPLPVYQRQYSGARYPRAEQQQALRSQNYSYQPREVVTRQQFQEHAAPRVPAPPSQRPNGAAQNPGRPDVQRPSPPDAQRPSPPTAAQQRQAAPVEPRARTSPRGGEDGQRSAPPQDRTQPVAPTAQEARGQPHQGAAAPEPPQPPRASPRNAPQGREPSQEPGRGQGQERERERGKGEERGQGRN